MASNQAAHDSVLEKLICCWADLLYGKACLVYNIIFAPFVLCFHATRIYFCGCLCIHFKRTFFNVCCCCCRKLGCCWEFTDKTFPPNMSSLGNVGGDSAEGGKKGKISEEDVAWVRAGSFAQSKSMQLFGDQVNASDICQGSLGDCWLLAAMACMAEHKGAIHSLFQTRERDPRGKYKIRLFDGQWGAWRVLTIDDLIPCKKQDWEARQKANPLFSQPNGNELWAILLEKAFAKLCGSFAALEGGATIWALQAMTGDFARWFELDNARTTWTRWDMEHVKSNEDKRKTTLKAGDEKIPEAKMWDVLVKYYGLQAVLCASGASGSHGLVSGHAYSILAAKKVGEFRMVQIRNPWGTGEWQGDWSDKSDLWKKNPKVAQGVGYTDADDGSFWMEWKDFLQNWKRIGVVDRSVDLSTLRLHVDESDPNCGPTRACCAGCCSYWCMCQGCKRLYCPYSSSKDTVATGSRCIIL